MAGDAARTFTNCARQIARAPGGRGADQPARRSRHAELDARTRRHQHAERADNGQVQRPNASCRRRAREQKRRRALGPLERVVMRILQDCWHPLLR